ncbi:prolyl-tRNA synthetase [Mycoplasma testudineum]|uniref:Proline--tRNA ligase n=1 Tax=Mycoplasma testudineum TaxID=244584 RepID=A0A4R6IEN6_9MOLU|nr:proline--tRNA ligase [Mycoplasma testudineum]OYD26953.1 proline--tRNA ligase [Mycoplasma testudineum]TDO20502.1 prolyl-tRNA synthetase [Mycoplasma testudineum]
MSKRKLNNITPQSEDFAKWYTDVVVNGKLIDYGPVRGTVIMRPNSFGIWENFQKIFNKILDSNDIRNMYLPMFIPKSLMDMESDHILGFAPELATITKVGEKLLTEEIYTRPTSEVLFCKYFAAHTSSYKDLPIKVNQWANVIRWEKTTNPFLRTTEFLWQEGHTVHADPLEARRFTRKMLKNYEKILANYLAIPVMIGKKTSREKFAGACTTYTCEAMMKDGKALQSATSHYLAHNFSKPFEIGFKNQQNDIEYAYQTSWGMSTRIIGALIMTHGDDRGVIIPPKIAATQVDILTFNPKLDIEQDNFSRELVKNLSRVFKVRADYSTATLGYKASESEIQGTPIRIEIGPRDFSNDSVTVVRRDTLEKEVVPVSKLKKHIKSLIEKIHNNLYDSAKQRMEDNISRVNEYSELKTNIAKNRWVIMPMCCSDNESEEKIQKETGATARLIMLGEDKKDSDSLDQLSKCGFCQEKETRRYVLFAKAY